VSPSPSPSPTPSAPVRVVINEVAWAGTQANASDEWIELYNPGGDPVELTGWALYEGDVRIIALTGTISAGAYYLVERTDDGTISDIPADLYGSFGGSGLKNLPTGEDLSLRDSGGIIMDSVLCAGGWFAGDSASKATMERKSSEVSGEVTDWATNDGSVTTGTDAAGNPIQGTPKFKNSVTL